MPTAMFGDQNPGWEVLKLAPPSCNARRNQSFESFRYIWPASANSRRFERHCDRCAAARALLMVGSNSAITSAMIAMATSNSTSENARWEDGRAADGRSVLNIFLRNDSCLLHHAPGPTSDHQDWGQKE